MTRRIMMKHSFGNEETVFYTNVLAAVALLLGALCFLRIAGFLAAASEVRAMAAWVSSDVQRTGAPEERDGLLASSKACAEELKKKNLFILTPPRRHPVSEVGGILGDEAWINGAWYKVGASVGDAKIVAIEPTKVRIAWDGREQEFSPIGSSGGGRQDGPSRPSRSMDGPRPAGRAEMAVSGVRRGPAPGGQAGPGSLEGRSRQRQNMSPEERQKAREQMRQQLRSRTQ